MEKDRYSRQLEGDLEPGLGAIEFDRREFLRITGTGIFVFFTIGKLEADFSRPAGKRLPG